MAAPPYLRISLRDAKTHYTRSEDFYMSAGQFAVRDLPAGHFVLEASADDSRTSTTLDLGAGENTDVTRCGHPLRELPDVS